MHIAHLSAEVSPLAKTGGLGDVAGALPKAQVALGDTVDVWMPYYRTAREWLRKKHAKVELACEPFNVHAGFRDFRVGLLRTVLPGSDVPLFLVGSDPHFERDAIYTAGWEGRDDGYERYTVFVRAVLEAMRRLQRVPNILHAHDWHAALAPMAVRWDRPRDWHFDRTATVLTIHNAAYQGLYAPDTFPTYGLPIGASGEAGLGWRGGLNLLKGGVLAADAITGVSPTFAREIRTRDGGFGLDPVLRHRGGDVVGIVNGIDPEVWNPRTDKRLPANYDASDFAGKLACRRELLTRAGMDPDDRGFVIGIVGRLVEQKGYDLLFPVLEQLLNDGIRFVMLGSGESALERLVWGFSQARRGRFHGHVGFDEDLSHLIEAGADAFLMPSRFEPCGLNQLYSLAYGTPPIVRRTGGLVDTVQAYDGRDPSHATGFGFDDADPGALRDTVRFAHHVYKDAATWTRIVKNGMARDFSWRRSAETYRTLYRQVLSRKKS